MKLVLKDIHRMLPVVFLFIFIILGHVLTPWVITKGYGFGENYRFIQGPNTTFHEVELYVDSIRRTEAHKIAFVGDSVVQGPFALEHETIPAYLEALMKERIDPGIEVYNLGMQGAHFYDLYFMIRYLHEQQAANEIIINLSYPFFSEEMYNIRSIYYRMLYPTLGPEDLQAIGKADYRPEEETDQEVAGNKGIEQYLVTQWINKYNVYRYRKDLNHILFGGHPVQRAKEWFDEKILGKEMIDETEQNQRPKSEKDREENKFKAWYEFGWSEEDIAHLRNVYNVADLQKEAKTLQPFVKLLDYAKEQQIRLSVLITPINMELLDRYDVLDHERFAKNMTYLKRLITQEYGFPVYEYQEKIPSHAYHDSLHLLGHGNRLVAELLTEDWQRAGEPK